MAKVLTLLQQHGNPCWLLRCDDSPGAQAKRLDRLNVTMNRDNQKKYANTSHIAQELSSVAAKKYIDPNALDKRIAARSQYHKDQSTIKGAASLVTSMDLNHLHLELRTC